MKVAIGYPPLGGEKGVPLLSQNRQFQWFCEPTYIYPMVPASAATLLDRHGFDVAWLDGIAGENTYEQWFSRLEQASPDILALETKTPVVRRHWEIIKDIKERLDSKIVLMGDHVTAFPEESLEQSPADYVLTGGDYDFLLDSLALHIRGGSAREPGIFWRGGNTGPFVLDHDLSSLPMIDRDLTQWKLYSEKNGNYKVTPGTYTMVARDCWWHRCTFCSWTTLYPKYRARRPEQLVEEIGDLITRYGVREIMDDSGSFPIGKWLERFCNGVIEKGYQREIRLDCNMRFGACSLEQYRLMRKAGFRFVLFGLESGNQATLDRLDKGLTIDEIVLSCKKAKQAGLNPHITIMFGYPWETMEDVQRTVKLGKYLMKKGYADTLQATVVIPYPGTPLFTECREQGLLKTEDWDRYDMKEPVMKTPIPEEELLEAVQSVYKVAFDPEFIVRKVIGIRSVDDVRFIARAGRKVVGHVRDFKGK
jgi:radical SAM superfamily enzyme YgiQ (UPF0313 family)